MKRRRWWIGGGLAVVAGLAIAVCAAWYAQSGLARWLAVRQIGSLTSRQASFERVDLDLRRGRLRIAGFRLADRAPGPPLAEIDHLDARFDPVALLRGRVVVHEAALGGVRAHIVRSERGELNVADLLAGGSRAGSASVALERLTLRGGSVSFEDRTRAPVHTWRADDIAAELAHLSTHPVGTRGEGRISATVAGAPVTGEVSELTVTPLHVRGRLVVKDADATVAGIFLPPDVRGIIERARLTADVTVLADAGDGLQVDAHGRVEGLALGHRGTGGSLVEVPELAFTVAGTRADPAGRVSRVGRVEITGGATVYDARGAAAGRLTVDGLRLQIADTEEPAPGARLTLAAGLSGGGRLDVDGPLQLAPLGAELRARVTQLDAAVLLSYADLPVSLTGVVESDLTVDVASADRLGARVRGRAAVSRGAAASGDVQVASAARIELDGIDVDVAASRPPRIGVARARVLQPMAVIARDTEGRVRLGPRVAAPAPTASAATPAVAARPIVDIAEIAVDDGSIVLDDAAAPAPVRLTLAKLRASARNVAWPPRGPVAVDLHGATPGAGTVEAKGTVSLDPLRLEIRARLAGAALAPYQGYAPFSGRVQGVAHADLAVTGALSPQLAVTAKGTASLSDLSVSAGDQRVMRVSRVESTGLDYTWPATLAVDRLRVGRSWVRVERRADGSVPLMAALGMPAAPGASGEAGRRAEPGPPIAVTVREAVLDEGAVRIIDAAVVPASRIDLAGVRLVAHGFSWPARGAIPIELRVGTPGGGSANASGTLDLTSGSIDVKATLAGVDLAPARPYVPLQGRIAGKVGGGLQIKARLDPLAIAARGDAVLADLAIAEGDRPVVTLARAEITGLDYTWPAKASIERLRVAGARAVVERRRDGTLPLVALFVAPTGPAPAAGRAESPAGAPGGGEGGPPRPGAAPAVELSIRESLLENGSVVLSDAAVSPPARLEVRGVRLDVRDLTWPSRAPASVRLHVPAPGGGTVTARGQLAAGAAGLDLDVAVDGVDVASVRPYLPLRGQVTGKANARLKVGATVEPPALTARGTASLDDLAVVDGERRLLTAAHAEATGLDYAWPASVSIDRLRVRKPWALLDRISGKLPVLDALVSAGSPGAVASRGPAPPPGAASSGPRLSVRRSALEEGGVTIVDSGVSPPAQVEIGGARLLVRDLAWPGRAPAGFTLRATAGDGATIDARGQLGLDPSSIDTTLALGGVDIATFQPFFAAATRLGGKATADLRIKGPLAPLDLSITGQMALTDASLGDRERTLATAKHIDLAGLVAQWPRRRAVVQRLVVREPWALVERSGDGALPLLSLVAMDGRAAPVSGPPPAAAAPPRSGDSPSLEVAALAVEEGFVRFADATTTPRFVEEVSHVALSVRGLGTAPAARSELSLSGRLTGGAQVDLSGVLGPLGGRLFVDARGKLSGLPLSRVNPYMSGLFGWVARQGSMDGTTHVRIRDDHLESDNEVVIGRPQFVPSRRDDEVRKRVGVPLDLLVSLLENARQEVRLSIPVTGTLSSREFDFGDAVWDAVRKMAINVLALPVSWVGKIFYTADARIDTIAIWPVAFEPGTTHMRRGIDAHAARLATFMRDTPAVAFTMKPVLTVEDVDAIKREAVRRRLAGPAAGAAQPDAAAVAARLFAERFPGRPVPGDLDAVIAELAAQEPSPDSAVRALATARLDLTRRGLVDKGVDAARLRLSDGVVPVEASGAGRVEFEMVPLAAPAS